MRKSTLALCLCLVIGCSVSVNAATPSKKNRALSHPDEIIYKPQKNTSQAAWPPPPAANAPITVTDTIYGVLRHHRELRGMQEDREVMTYEWRRAQAGFGPSVDLQGSAGTAIISDSSTRRHDLDRTFLGVVEGSARLTQPIWDGFATRSRVRSAFSTLASVKDRVLIPLPPFR